MVVDYCMSWISGGDDSTMIDENEKKALFEKQISKGGLDLRVIRKGKTVLNKKIGRFKGHGKVEYDVPKKQEVK